MNEENAHDEDQAAEGDRIERGPRIYVASLADYNAGRLHGIWLDADNDIDSLDASIASMLRTSPEPYAEDWAIHDYEGFGDLRLDESESLAFVGEMAHGIVEHGPAFAAWAAHVDSDEAERGRFEDAYLGEWDSVADYAEELLDDLGATEFIEQAPEWLRGYLDLDVDAFIRDLWASGEIIVASTPRGRVWLFRRT